MTLKSRSTNITPLKKTMAENETTTKLQILEESLNSLILLCSRLQEENRTLKVKQESLVKDRAQLIEKTALAKNRVESMITRLKSMEHIA